jgi:cytochrome b561
MTIRNSSNRWGSLSQLLHWLIVVLIAAQVALALTAKELPRGPMVRTLVGYHKSVGITILALAVIRLAWRWMNPVPALPDTIEAHEKALARLTHGALYVILFAMPLSGWIGSSAHGFPVKWFNLFTVPALTGKDLPLSSIMSEVHYVLAISLGLIVLLHIAAALKHHFVLKDDTLRRMLPGSADTAPYEVAGGRAAKQSSRV